MKKYLIFIILFLGVSLSLILIVTTNKERDENQVQVKETTTDTALEKEETQTGMANPASKYCAENGGTVEIITNKDGSQFGMCNFKDFSCEEWAYFRKECAVEEDAEKIKQALIAKGLDLSDMKVVIHKHLGKYISGGVVPVSVPGGGGYVFAVKEDGEIKIVADGNGVIMCEMLEDYPDYPTYLISHCVDETGNSISR